MWENSVGECGKEILRCNEAGVYINLPGGESKVLSYALNRKDEYFSPYIKIVRGTNEMLYDAHINATVQARAAEVASSAPDSIITIRNPFGSLSRVDSSDVEFQKFHQCQKRTYFGMPNLRQLPRHAQHWTRRARGGQEPNRVLRQRHAVLL